MVRKHTFPRVNRGDTIYRVEWKKERPFLVHYTVEGAMASSIAVKDADGREHRLMGKVALQKFATTPDDAVYQEFESIAMNVIKHGIDRKTSLNRCAGLASILE